MNLASEEDWLSDDKFDFDLNVSSFSLESGDNELGGFFLEPTQTRNANEAKSQSSVPFRIKNPVTTGIGLRGNAPNRSPVAVVHPMRREFPVVTREEDKENIPSDGLENTNNDDEPIEEKKLNCNDQEDTQKSNIHEKLEGLNKKTRAGTTPENSVKLDGGKPASQVKNKSNLQTLKTKTPGTKPCLLKDENSAVGLSKPGSQVLQKRLKKPLMIPKPGSISKTKSGGTIPSSLLSILPNQSKPNSGLKPLKPTSQSSSGISLAGENQSTKSVVGVAQPQLKWPGRKYASTGTPTEHKKSTIGSAQQKSLGRKAHSMSVSNTHSEKKLQKPPNSETKRTPLAKSRRSIVGRKLNHDAEKSNGPTVIEHACQNTNDVGCKENNEIEVVCDELKEDSKMIINKNKSAKKESCASNVVIPDSDAIIMNVTNSASTVSDVECAEGINFVQTVLHDKVTVESSEISLKRHAAGVEGIVNHAENIPLLIDFENIDSGKNQISPVRFNNMDPFETGNTPPPLIQLDIVLEPERPLELNLIEF